MDLIDSFPISALFRCSNYCTSTIDAPDMVCRTQDREAGVTLPDGIPDAVLTCEFIGLGGEVETTVEDGKLYGVVTANRYPDVENSFKKRNISLT